MATLVPMLGASSRFTERGLTVLGVVVSAAILASGIAAALLLVGRTIHIASVGREESQALNLAREGIELVEAVRDNNWFGSSAVTWTETLCEEDESFPTDHQLIIDTDDDGTIQIDIGGNPQLFVTNNGRLTHQSAGYTPSAYSRQIIIDCSQRGSDPAFITVTSRVTWDRAGQLRTLDIRSRLYNWYIKS